MTVVTPPSNEPFKDPTTQLADDPIVTGLKRLYDSVLEESVPEEFMSLLMKIDETLLVPLSSSSTNPAAASAGAPVQGELGVASAFAVASDRPEDLPTSEIK